MNNRQVVYQARLRGAGGDSTSFTRRPPFFVLKRIAEIVVCIPLAVLLALVWAGAFMVGCLREVVRGCLERAAGKKVRS